ncbi:MAG: putative cytochrome [Ramlibacter sp.]|nr:putative cytochrome [Ramlibacter sp.]
MPIAWQYGAPAIALHWLLAVLISFMAGLGWYMMTVEHEPGGDWYMNLHKSVGLVVFVLVLLRIVWRAFHAPEPLPPNTPRWQVQSAKATQWLLYACMVVLPVTGILGASYSRPGLAFFGMQVPMWAATSRATSKLFFTIHSFTVWVLVALVVLHVLGGLKHLLVDRDEVFRRMWPN